MSTEAKGVKAGSAIPAIEQPSTSNRTRPLQVSHRAAKRNADVQRYTVDLDRDQRRTLAMFAAEWEVDKSRIVRTLLYLLEADESLRGRVQQELFAEDEAAEVTE